MKFKQILSSKDKLGKKTYECDVPGDIIQMAKRTKRRYVGVGTWLNTKQKFICFVSPNDSFYIDAHAFREAIDLFRGYGK